MMQKIPVQAELGRDTFRKLKMRAQQAGRSTIIVGEPKVFHPALRTATAGNDITVQRNRTIPGQHPAFEIYASC